MRTRGSIRIRVRRPAVKRIAQPSRGEAELARQIQLTGLPEPVREYAFAKPRRWRFDFAWPEQRVALEVEGGTWSAGRHSRGAGFELDCEKYAEAGIGGWVVIRATTGQVMRGEALRWVERALTASPEPCDNGGRRAVLATPHARLSTGT